MKKPTRKTRSITIIGRKWFDNVNGNTYHSSQVLVNGVTIIRSDYTYGYGSAYEDTAHHYLIAYKYCPKLIGKHPQRLRTWCQENGVTYETMAICVKCKKDMCPWEVMKFPLMKDILGN